ncbi:MAG TPA: hypothetical protein VGL03_09630 [Thermoanaerobaculia bacterium]|jgi:hypothetical protein
MQKILRSIQIYLGLMVYLVAVKLALTAFPGVFRSPAQAAVFDWPLLALWTVLGLMGVWLAEKTGFAPAWQGDVSNRARILVPALLGAGFGLLAIVTDAATGWTRFVAAKMGIATIHISFPASLLIYPGGAIIVEVLYRLFPIPLLLWLISTKLCRGRWQDPIFWTLAVLTSLVEPYGDLGLRNLGFVTMLSVFLQDFALNLAQASLFRRYGFLAAILLRVSFYLIWHVVWGLAR